MKTRTHKGIFYFPTHRSAHAYAAEHDAPASNRIIQYGRGYAIQLHVSGPYVGPAEGYTL